MNHILMSRGILDAPYLIEECKTLIHKHHKVVVIAFSFFWFQAPNKESYDALYGTKGTYRIKIIDAFSPYGINPTQIEFCHYYDDDLKTLNQKISQADIIYLPGGAPDLFIKRLEEKQIKSTITNNKKALMIGSSAGAMIQLDTYHISKDDEYNAFSWQKGLNLLNGFDIEVHYRRKKVQKRGLKRVFREKHIPIFAIPDDGAIIIKDGIINHLRSYQVYDHKGIIKKGLVK